MIKKTLVALVFVGIGGAHADGGIEHIVVNGYRSGFARNTVSAGEGHIGFQQLQFLPWQRVGEMLETVPGLIVSQHSGEGKANQFYLRGFNLDHGTDFAMSVNGIPVNLRSHGHGQGYTDLNFLIPELIGAIDFRKGSYRGDDGDFATAGSANIVYGYLPDTQIALTAGADNYQRWFAGNHWHQNEHSLMAAVAIERDDGPWDLAQQLDKQQAYFSWSLNNGDSQWLVDAMLYRNEWRSSDQIPQRAVDEGLIGRFDTIDRSDGGDTARDSISARWSYNRDTVTMLAQLYALRYELDLFSNFTYFLNDPLRGDQFEQRDQRHVYGGRWQWSQEWSQWRLSWGVDSQFDRIDDVGLFLTQQRQRHATLRRDSVDADSTSLYVEAQWLPSSQWQFITALQQQFYRVDVASDRDVNSGRADDQLLSPRLSMVYRANDRHTFFINAGRGFHSNDARGATTRVDPVDGVTALQPVDLLVASDAYDMGWTTRFRRWQMSINGFALDIDSELLFIGDGGTTEATRPSRRRGVEVAGFWQINATTLLDLSWAKARARFRDHAAEGDYIPGAPEQIAAIGLSYSDTLYSLGVRWRYFGARALTEDNQQRSRSSALLNVNAGWQINKHWQLNASLLNVLDREQDGIRYYYESRLSHESESQMDEHFHPVEPRALRVGVQANW